MTSLPMSGELAVPVRATSSLLTGRSRSEGRRLQKLVAVLSLIVHSVVAADADVRTHSCSSTYDVRRRYADYVNRAPTSPFSKSEVRIN